ncbi:Z-ring formation inhibitor MciZ [Paenibacillus sedimenti]|uniref:Z-ring formation inhibitor MciZ n=1 Tax=Paenibacillus sedimenti TaxID=2770274 RepID=A0A926KRE2_9BACL|nr:Z-ring formation inhibitor MciZ [Paenibacillus sedimenti]MBD0380675.1 Z-ring formation inhibitor MciZ [Paenibacillus sedimenti]
MKSYVTDRQIRLVGKAWEIKRHLQVLLQQAGKDVKLIDYARSLPTPLLHKPFEKKQGPHIIPFPSR